MRALVSKTAEFSAQTFLKYIQKTGLCNAPARCEMAESTQMRNWHVLTIAAVLRISVEIKLVMSLPV